jgi:ATP-binding cassette, subfamily B, bacterial PglK
MRLAFYPLMMKNSFLHDAYRLVNSSQRKRGLGIILILVMNSVLDFFSLAFFLPVIFLLVNPGAVHDNFLFQRVYEFFGFSTVSSFAIAITISVFIFIAFKTLINAWITEQKARYAYQIGSEMASRAVTRYLNLPYLKFTQTELSQEVNLISNMPLIFANNIVIPSGTLLSEALVFLLLLVGVAIYNVKAFGFLSMILIPAFILYRLRRKRLKRIGSMLRNTYPTLLKYTLLIVEGLPDILAFRKEAFYKKEFEKVSRNLGKTFSADHAVHTGTPRVTEVIAAGCVCLMIVYALLNQNDQQKTLMLLGVYAAVSFRIIPSVNRIIASVQQMKVHEYSIREFRLIMDDQENFPLEAPDSPLPFNNQMTLRNISFSYPGHSRTLSHTDLIIRKGEKIALTGKSGAGKSTLLLIILGFLQEQEGEILIDSYKQESNRRSRRNLLGYVPQHPYIMDGSVLENIAFGVPPDKVDLEKANRLVLGMDLAGWISSLPQGIHTRIGEKGAKISGGQRQRLAIARTLYYDAEILLLDEVTNQLDPQTEKEVVTTLLNLSDQSKTILMITHHPELLKKFETVYELVNGGLEKVTEKNFQSSGLT